MPNSELNYTFEDIDEKLQAKYEGKHVVFVKDFASQVVMRYDKFLQDGFKDFTHSFLIRDPQRTVLSLYEALNFDLDQFKEAKERGDIGITALYDLYQFLHNKMGIKPIVVDVDDVLNDPENMMAAYCRKVGLTYKKGMSKWEPWPNEGSCWDELKEFHFFTGDNSWVIDAIKSTHHKQQTNQQTTTNEHNSMPKNSTSFLLK